LIGPGSCSKQFGSFVIAKAAVEVAAKAIAPKGFFLGIVAVVAAIVELLGAFEGPRDHFLVGASTVGGFVDQY